MRTSLSQFFRIRYWAPHKLVFAYYLDAASDYFLYSTRKPLADQFLLILFGGILCQVYFANYMRAPLKSIYLHGIWGPYDKFRNVIVIVIVDHKG